MYSSYLYINYHEQSFGNEDCAAGMYPPSIMSSMFFLDLSSVSVVHTAVL